MAAVAGTGGSCRICGGPLPPRRRTLCSDECRRRAKTDYQLEWQRDNPGKHAGYTAKTRDRNGPRIREAKLLSRYNLTLGQYYELWKSQNGSCAICGLPEGNRSLHVDHDHACCSGSTSCGQCVRALLCFQCNAGLGNFRDDPGLLTRAIEYLKGR